VGAGAKHRGINVFATDNTDFVLHVSDYFVPNVGAPAALHYFSF
jgi:hypothetical protein